MSSSYPPGFDGVFPWDEDEGPCAQIGICMRGKDLDVEDCECPSCEQCGYEWPTPHDCGAHIRAVKEMQRAEDEAMDGLATINRGYCTDA